MNKEINEIAKKFIKDENISMKQSLLMATMGLTKNVGDIADIAYGVNFSQHPLNTERQNMLADYLGYALLNWHILALATGINGDEIAKRFVTEWQTKHNEKASIKDLLKHLKTNVKQETTTQQQQVTAKPTQIETLHQL